VRKKEEEEKENQDWKKEEEEKENQDWKFFFGQNDQKKP